MRDSQGNPVLGRTKWLRFAFVAVPATAAVGALVFGMADGALAAHIAVSGQQFKVSADRLDGTGFKQYGDIDTKSDDTVIPVARSVIGHAELTNLCQSVDATTPLLPFGKIVLRIEAGGGGVPAEADDLQIGLNELSGDATFTNIEIGNDGGPAGLGGPLPMSFGQSADRIVIDDLRQTATSTYASTFTLSGLSLRVLVDSNLPNGGECFG